VRVSWYKHTCACTPTLRQNRENTRQPWHPYLSLWRKQPQRHQQAASTSALHRYIHIYLYIYMYIYIYVYTSWNPHPTQSWPFTVPLRSAQKKLNIHASPWRSRFRVVAQTASDHPHWCASDSAGPWLAPAASHKDLHWTRSVFEHFLRKFLFVMWHRLCVPGLLHLHWVVFQMMGTAWGYFRHTKTTCCT